MLPVSLGRENVLTDLHGVIDVTRETTQIIMDTVQYFEINPNRVMQDLDESPLRG